MNGDNGVADEFPFDIYAGRLPDEMPRTTRSMLLDLRDVFSRARDTATVVVAYTPIRWSFVPSSIHLHTVGDFRSPYFYVNAIAKLIARTYLEFEIMPLIYPYRHEEWALLSDIQPLTFTHLSTRGLLTFSSRRLQ